MDSEPSLDECLKNLEECFTLTSEAEASKCIVRLLLLENEETKSALRSVLSKQLLKNNSKRLQKSILVVLGCFGVESADFPALQKCIGLDDSAEFLAWRIMAKNAKKKIDKDYVCKTREIWQQGLNDGDPQVRLAAISLLEIANEDEDLIAISRRLLDQDEQVRQKAITSLSAHKQSAQLCREQISEFFKQVAEDKHINMRQFELGRLVSMCEKSGTSFIDSAPVVLLFQKIEAGPRDLMYEIMLMTAYQLVGLCGENAKDLFPELKTNFMNTLDFRALRACLFMAARVSSLNQEVLNLVDHAVTNAKSESTALQAIKDLCILGEAARPYIPRLIEIFEDLSLGHARFSAATALAKLLDKKKDAKEIECLLSHLKDSNLVVVQGACTALGTIFQDDSQTDPRIPEAIAALSKHSDQRVRDVSLIAYKQVTGTELVLDKGSDKDLVKMLFAGLNDPDPFVVLEKLYFLAQRPELNAAELADFVDFMPLIWDLVFNTPTKFSAMTPDGAARIKLSAMKVFARYGSLAEAYVPQLMQAVLEISKKGTMNELNQAIVSTLAFIGKNSEEVLALFRTELLKESGNHWTAPLLLMGDAGWSTLIQVLEIKTAKLNKMPSGSTELNENLAAAQESLAALLSGQPERSLDAIPTLIEIVLNRAQQSKSVHWCGGKETNNRFTAARALMKIAPRDSRVLSLIERLRNDPAEKELYDLLCRLQEFAKQQENLIELTADAQELASQLFLAVNGSDLTQLKALLAAGADPSARLPGPANQTDTVLIQAVRQKNIKFVRALVEAGADVNASGMQGNSAMKTACDFDCLEIVLYLLENGAQNPYCVPLIVASSLGQFELALGLILYGVDPNQLGKLPHQPNALACAARGSRNHRLVDELLLVGAHPAQSEQTNGNTWAITPKS